MAESDQLDVSCVKTKPIKIGVLGLQGAFAKHIEIFNSLEGVESLAVRSPEDLASCDGLVIPGGESTVISQLIETSGLRKPLEQLVATKRVPIWGTCAGMIILGSSLANAGPADEKVNQFKAIDIEVERNSYGRQIASFEASVTVNTEAISTEGSDSTEFEAVFIRAPKATKVGANVQVLASCDGNPVLMRHENILVSSFHPELTDDPLIHELFVEMCRPS